MIEKPGPIDFYFEFSSPYGYIASQVADEFEQRVGRPLAWRPILLGPVFKITGQAPLVDIPMKGDYSRKDFTRSARFHQVPFRHRDRGPNKTRGTRPPCRWETSRGAGRAPGGSAPSE